MKKIFTSVAVIGATMAAAQVGINTETPKATLDVTAKTTDGTKPEGIIAPRLTGDQIKAADAQYLAAQTGTIVYATSASADAGVAAAKTTNITAEGYYYFDGAIWQKFNSGAAAGTEPWYNVATNAGATANTQNIYQMGNVGVGTNLPSAKLDIVDSITVDKTTNYNTASGFQLLNLGAVTSNRSYRAGAFRTDIDPSSTTTFTQNLIGARTGVWDPSASNYNGSGGITGIYNLNMKGSTGTMPTMYGIDNHITINGSSIIQTQLTGQLNYIDLLSSNKQPNVIGNQNVIRADGSSIGTYKGVSVQKGGSQLLNADNFYGFYADATLADVNGSNKWAFYNDANIPSYFKGNVGIGTTTPTGYLQVNDITTNPELLQHRLGTLGYSIISNVSVNSLNLPQRTGLFLQQANNYPAQASPTVKLTKFRGTIASPEPLLANDEIGTILAESRKGNNLFISGGMYFFADENWSATNNSTGIKFSTSTGTLNPVERMRISSTGNVGIGTNAPSNALHINATNPVRLEGLQAGAATDNVVVADATGVLKTIPASSVTSTINTVLGVMGAGTGRTVSTADDSVNEYYKTGAYIDLPPGKWAVNVVMLMTPSILTPYTEVTTPNDSSFWVRTSFVDTDPGTSAVTISATSPYIQGSYYISGNLPGASVFSFAQGTMVINNTGTVSHRYYYIAGGVASRNTTLSLNQFGNYQWAEDQIIAYKIN